MTTHEAIHFQKAKVLQKFLFLMILPIKVQLTRIKEYARKTDPNTTQTQMGEKERIPLPGM